MDEIEIIDIPVEDFNEKQVRLIEMLLKMAKTLNVDGDSVKTDPIVEREAA